MTDTIRTIVLSSHILAQGDVLARHADGGVSIDAGGRTFRGVPIPSIRSLESRSSVT